MTNDRWIQYNELFKLVKDSEPYKDIGSNTGQGTLRILDKNTVIMELKLVVSSRNNAKWIVKNWGDKAAQVYGFLHETLMEN